MIFSIDALSGQRTWVSHVIMKIFLKGDKKLVLLSMFVWWANNLLSLASSQDHNAHISFSFLGCILYLCLLVWVWELTPQPQHYVSDIVIHNCGFFSMSGVIGCSDQTIRWHSRKAWMAIVVAVHRILNCWVLWWMVARLKLADLMYLNLIVRHWRSSNIHIMMRIKSEISLVDVRLGRYWIKFEWSNVTIMFIFVCFVVCVWEMLKIRHLGVAYRELR